MRLAVAFCLLATPLAAESSFSVTDSCIMGAGRWTCAAVIETAQSGDPSRVGQLAGWGLGVWSAAPSERGLGFTNTVEQVGGQGIYRATPDECARPPGSTALCRVVYSMIDNTNPPS